ncbi:MAG: MFS transporter [Desulfovibrionaceae bacterium]
MNDIHKMRRKAIVASIIGTTLEWYDFFLYGVIAALILNKQYFPTADPFISNLMAWGSVAVAFISRPLGGVIFGHFGDKIGRKYMLMITLLIMGVSTVLIGCLPTYQQIGVWAPVLLITLRTVQGIGLGGEWGGAVLMTYEYATEGKRCLYGSLTQLGLSIGMFLASGIVGLMTLLLSEEAFLSWGWRIPFLISIILLGIGYYIRISVMETPDFQEAQKNKVHKKHAKIPIVELFSQHKSRVLAGFLARGIGGVGFNVMATYVIAYLTQIIKVPREDALLAVNIGTVFLTLMIPFAGWLGDRYGRMKVFTLGCLLEGVCAFPIFYMINHAAGSIILACIGVSIYLGFIHGIISGLNPGMFSSLFPTHVRYTGISFTFQTSSMVFSGMTPMIALTLVRMNDNQPWLLCTYMLLVGLLSAAASLWIKRDQDRELREAQQTAGTST